MQVEEQGWKLLTRGVIHAWQHDHFGHMNVRWYAHLFDDAAFFIWSAFGMNLDQLLKEYGLHTVSASAKTDFIKELTAGSLVEVDGRIARMGTKSMTFEFKLINFDTREVHAKYHLVEVFFDPKTRTSANIPGPLRESLKKAISVNK